MTEPELPIDEPSPLVPPPAPPPDGVALLVPLVGAPSDPLPALTAWADYLATLGRPAELVVLDDGSRDRAAIDAWMGERQNVRILAASSFGESLRVGLGAAMHPLVGYALLDYPYSSADFGELLKRIELAEPESGLVLDLVSGCRAGRPTPIVARVTGTLWRGFWNLLLDLHIAKPPGWLGLRWGWLAFWSRMLFGLRLRDPASGLKLFRKKIFPRIPIQSAGPFAAIEILAKANFLGCFMDELPVAGEAGSTSPPLPRLGRIMPDFRKVFGRPDFGPPVLPTLPEAIAHAESH